MEQVSVWWLAYPLLGACVSIIAGMFGIGGGLVIVPVLYVLFTLQGFAFEHLMHVALGTTMVSMIITTLTSANIHRKMGNVKWPIARVMGVGLTLGSVIGSLVASQLPTRQLTLYFGLIVVMAALQMLLGLKPKPTRQLPSALAQSAVALTIGAIAALVAATGGFLITPYLAWHNVPMKNAIGTAAAIGVPVAIAGGLIYCISGIGAQNLPPLTLGYVNLPALLGIVSCSSLFTATGARIVSTLDGDKVKRIFGAYLLLVSLKMLYSALA